MQTPRKPRFEEAIESVDEHAELIAQLGLLAPIRQRKKDKALAAVAEAKQQLQQLEQQHRQQQHALTAQQQATQQRLSELDAQHQGKALVRVAVEDWRTQETQALDDLYNKQAALGGTALRIDEQQQRIDQLHKAHAEADKQQQRLDLLLDHLRTEGDDD